jgi:putative ubiquitin-RnfH superfamily antitoxin RatB of RatAB toxin-antitoxin module
MAAETIQVQVCYATAVHEYFRELTVSVGTTIGQAIEQSGVLTDIPGIDLAVQPVGLYGKKKPLETVLRENDRIEIYRALVADPKESRRRRAEKGGKSAAAGA